MGFCEASGLVREEVLPVHSSCRSVMSSAKELTDVGKSMGLDGEDLLKFIREE